MENKPFIQLRVSATFKLFQTEGKCLNLFYLNQFLNPIQSHKLQFKTNIVLVDCWLLIIIKIMNGSKHVSKVSRGFLKGLIRALYMQNGI